MALDSVTLEDALQLMSLPRVVGVDPESGDEITAQNGRYGPYLKKGTDSRTLPSEEAMFTITLDEALEIYTQPKRGRGRTATPPLRELGDDPNVGKPIQVKDGRFGAYVTDGETNRTLPRDVTPGVDHRGAGDRAARGEARPGAGEEAHHAVDDGQEAGGEEGPRQEAGRQEGVDLEVARVRRVGHPGDLHV